MDRNFGQNLSGAYEGEVDLFEYTKYLDYTGAMYLEADREEQENILISGYVSQLVSRYSFNVST